MRPGARSKLWFRSIRNGTEWRNPEETEDEMATGSSKEVHNSVVSNETVRMESKPCSKSTTAISKKEQPSHSGFRGKWVSKDTLPMSPG